MPSIVGTWKLAHSAARDAAGAALPAPYGGKGIGRVTFTAEGRMMSVVCDGRRELPAGAPREYSSYCGNYTFDGSRLVTRVDAASDPSRIGSSTNAPASVVVITPHSTGTTFPTRRIYPVKGSRRPRVSTPPTSKASAG